MDWSQKEENGAAELWGNTIGKGGSFRDALRAVMSRAVELVAARVPDEADLEALIREHVGPTDGRDAEAVRRAFHAQGATVATFQAKVEELENDLQAERDANQLQFDVLFETIHEPPSELTGADRRVEIFRRTGDRLARDLSASRAEAERLKAALTGSSAAAAEWCKRAETAESRLAAVRERGRQRAEMYERIDAETGLEQALADSAAAWMLGGDAPREAKDEPKAVLHNLTDHGGTLVLSDRGITTLDGRPARYPCSPTCTHDDAANQGHPERVRERSDAVSRLDHVDGVLDATFSGYEEGAEAMRAACLSAAMGWAQMNGLSLAMQDALKAAIEGAVP